MAYSGIEPFGTDALYLAGAIVAKTIADVNRGSDQQPYELSKFIPQFEPTKPQTEEEMIQLAAMWTLAKGGKDLRKEKK